MLKKALKSVFYSSLDIATFGRGVARSINNVKVRFPVRWSRYYESNYESANYQFLSQYLKAGMQVVDVGAHIGLFSTISSRLVGSTGRIISVEPTPSTFDVLTKTLSLNKCSNATPIQAAVSNEAGKATFYMSDTAGDNANSLVKANNRNAGGYEVELVTLDGIIKNHNLTPSLLKIDAEGAELDVLKGGRDTILKHKPALILGLHPNAIKEKGDSLEAIWNLLQEYGYKVELDGKIISKSEFCSYTSLFDVHCF